MTKPSLLVFALLAATSAPALAAPVAATQAAAADAAVGFDVYLPLRNAAALDDLIADQQKEGSANYHKWLSPADFKARFGPTDDSMARAQAAARAAGLQITRTGTRSFHVTANAATVGKALNTTLRVASDPSTGKSRFFASGVTLPAALAAEGAKVLSFSGVPAKKPFATRENARLLAAPDNRYGPDGPYWYNDLKQAYDYPSSPSTLPNGQRLDGTGVRVAVLMSDLLFPQDLPAIFNHENYTKTSGKRPPLVSTVLVNGGGTTDGPGSFEASLDVQQVLGGAPGSSVTLVSIPDLSDDNILAGYQYIVDQNRFDVVNSSFGGCELFYTAAYNGGKDMTYILQAYEDIFKQGNAQGITFVASSGDNGGLECTTPNYVTGSGGNATFIKGVSTPAASPSVTAVGGGNLVTASDGTLNSAYFGENGQGDPLVPYDPYALGSNVSGGYWGAGGGVSTISRKPSYQNLVNTGSDSQRTLPDVGMQVGGCPGGISQLPCGPDRSAVVTAYAVGTPAGGFYGVIGTSVSSPEFVGALALYIQKTGGRVGNFNYYLYALGAAQTQAGGTRAPASSQYYHRNAPGFDGVYRDTYPSVNYNYIYGNGSPDVRKLFGFTNLRPAGVPQTTTNP